MDKLFSSHRRARRSGSKSAGKDITPVATAARACGYGGGDSSRCGAASHVIDLVEGSMGKATVHHLKRFAT